MPTRNAYDDESVRLSDSCESINEDFGKTPYDRHRQNVMDKLFYKS